MNKAEAIKIIKTAKVYTPEEMEALETLIPELRESEDERIRKFLIDILSHGTWRKEWPFGPSEVVAWLEKQKETVAISDNGTPRSLADEFAEIESNDHEAEATQDYSGLAELERAIHRGFLCAGVENVPVEIIKETAQDCLNQMKPAEWSEGEITHLYTLANFIKCSGYEDDGEFLEGIANKLKSLRPSWKPSEEQMEALDQAQGEMCQAEYNGALCSLIDDLQKL